MRSMTIAHHNQKIREAVRYISRRLEEPLTLESLSRRSNFAPFYFHRVFREVTGQPVYQFIRSLRLDMAAYRLVSTNWSIIDIAMEAGYASHEAFTRAFKQQFHLTPSSLRHGSNGRPQRLDNINREGTLRRISWPARKLIFVSHFGPYEEVHSCWGRLFTWLRQQRLPIDSTQPVGILYDDPTDPFNEKVRYDACVAIPFDFAPRDRIGIQVLPQQDTLTIDHQSSRELFINTFTQLVVRAVLEGNGPRLRRFPFYEKYSRFPFPDESGSIYAEIHVALNRGNL